MRRWLFNLAAAVSLTLWVVMVAAWVSTLFIWPRIDYQSLQASRGVGTSWVLYSHIGGISFSWSRWQPIPGPDRSGWHWYTVPQSPLPVRQRLGIRAPSLEYRDKPFGAMTAMRLWSLFVPYWLPLLVFTVLPLIWWSRHARERRRRARSLCPTCGYDLRATPDRCPECGSVPAERARAAAR